MNYLARVILDSVIALDYLLAEQEEIHIIANTSCLAYISNSERKFKPNYANNADWLVKVKTESDYNIFDLFSWLNLGKWAPWFWGIFQTLDIILPLIILVMSLVYCIFSCIFSAFQQPLTNQIFSA